MSNWLLLGILAALFFGTSTIATKLATSPKFSGLNPAVASVIFVAGIVIVFAAGFWFLEGKLEVPTNLPGVGFALLAGALWALGQLMVLLALKGGADVAKLVPIFNTNTLVAVVLGIVLLHELPQAPDAVKVVVGAVLIVAGSILVSL